MARPARWARRPSAMDDVMANSAPKVSPAQRRTARACSTGSAMPSNCASAVAASSGVASSGVGRTAIVTPSLLSRSVGPRRPAGRRRNASRSPTPRRRGSAPRPRSTGSGTPAAAGSFPTAVPRSQQPLLLGAGDVVGEGLVGGPALEETAQYPLAVVDGLGLGHLVTAELAAEGGLHAEVAAQVHLEALDHLAVGVADHRALEPDVGGLESGAAVRAAVDVDADRHIEVGQPLLQLRVQVLRVLLGLDDRELAELQAGASHRAAAEGARADQQVVLGER